MYLIDKSPCTSNGSVDDFESLMDKQDREIGYNWQLFAWFSITYTWITICELVCVFEIYKTRSVLISYRGTSCYSWLSARTILRSLQCVVVHTTVFVTIAVSTRNIRSHRNRCSVSTFLRVFVNNLYQK